MNFINGEKITQISDFIYSIKLPGVDDYYNYPNTFNKETIELFDKTPVIYTHTQYVKILFSLLKNINKSIVLITHNSDINVDESLISKLPDNVIKWYSQNVNIIDSRLESIPIGLENSIWFPHINKQEKIRQYINRDIKNQNLLYINHNINTNIKEREEPYIIFKDKHFVTLVNGRNGQDFDSYLYNIKSHKFILCPDGNGIDTHRIWETLYLKSIPIVKRGINNSFYQELPICFVDKWTDITEEFLNNEYERIINKNWNNEKLNFDYWKNKILNSAKR